MAGSSRRWTTLASAAKGWTWTFSRSAFTPCCTATRASHRKVPTLDQQTLHQFHLAPVHTLLGRATVLMQYLKVLSHGLPGLPQEMIPNLHARTCQAIHGTRPAWISQCSGTNPARAPAGKSPLLRLVRARTELNFMSSVADIGVTYSLFPSARSVSPQASRSSSATSSCRLISFTHLPFDSSGPPQGEARQKIASVPELQASCKTGASDGVKSRGVLPSRLASARRASVYGAWPGETPRIGDFSLGFISLSGTGTPG